MFGQGARRALCRSGGAVAALAAVGPRGSRVRAEEKPPETDSWHYGYRWFVNEARDSAAGSSKSPAVWGSGLRAPRQQGAARRDREPSFTRAEVAACDGSGPDGRILVTYRDGVYDVTEYVKEHPGRHHILQAAGGPVDPWWQHWAQHHMSGQVQEALERLRAGHLSDHVPLDDDARHGGGNWSEEQLLPNRVESRRTSWRISEMPFQTVTDCAALLGSYLTPRDTLYVRNHAPVPSVAQDEAEEHEVAFCVGDEEVAALSLAELRKRFEQRRVTSVLQCSGNRGADNIAENGTEASGFSGSDNEFIGLGMLGNAQWSGASLSEVLTAVIPENVRADWCAQDLHVTFEGLDGYYTSTPLRRVMDRSKDCLLATDMNGSPLTPDHGFPLRAVLPGVVGARQVKWVNKITIGPLSEAPWTRHYYLDKPSNVPVEALPMNSVILTPEPGDQVSAGQTVLKVQGVAYGGGSDREIARVEVSADKGRSWTEAKCLFDEIERADAQGVYRGWVRFAAELPLPRASGVGSGRSLDEVWCRAVDTEGTEQPKRSEAHGGYLYNGFHRVPIVRR